MSIELPFKNHGRTCPVCGSAARIHPIADRHAPGGFSRQVSCVNYGYGCEYSESADAQVEDAQRVHRDNQAILQEWKGVEDQPSEEVPVALVAHMGRRIAPCIEDACRRADALIAKLKTQRALEDIAKRPSIRDRRP